MGRTKQYPRDTLINERVYIQKPNGTIVTSKRATAKSVRENMRNGNKIILARALTDRNQHYVKDRMWRAAVSTILACKVDKNMAPAMSRGQVRYRTARKREYQRVFYYPHLVRTPSAPPAPLPHEEEEEEEDEQVIDHVREEERREEEGEEEGEEEEEEEEGEEEGEEEEEEGESQVSHISEKSAEHGLSDEEDDESVHMEEADDEEQEGDHVERERQGTPHQQQTSSLSPPPPPPPAAQSVPFMHLPFLHGQGYFFIIQPAVYYLPQQQQQRPPS